MGRRAEAIGGERSGRVDEASDGEPRDERGGNLDTRNNRDFGDAMIRSVFDEVSGAI